VVNDFEVSVFSKYPQIERLKQRLYEHGAIYASMTGSGSAVYGLFKSETDLDELKASVFWSGFLN
ncbi:MAG: 4-(cytidine 5'-diphospho)-2-C-methyl-D-erythritol kinase, partial [Bacteroidota bacterium]